MAVKENMIYDKSFAFAVEVEHSGDGFSKNTAGTVFSVFAV